ncbi:glycosyltransferase [Empedobacter sp. GD03797]|uniref:glycosyltransferase family 2 protein n=1 Tax=Empedobacter sp. GD03797 TaxID=2975382 RepID=UPI002449F213|nr:glycosyltransferase [Empedobacter sp. GD03797]MDH1881998.1 glycosyltransferase [Empedobacter sp. GD03797]
MNYPKVSIVTITYGHENYIIETLKGVLKQQYNGEIEFIISNDASPDKTNEVLQDYLSENHIPENIKIDYTNHQNNLGIMPNSLWALNRASGDYVAICDGDDYWTDALKIQKQVDYLEMNKEYILVGHNVQIFDNETNIVLNESFPFVDHKKTISEDFIFKKNYIPTLSMMYRNVSKIPNWILDCKIGDYPLILYFSQFGRIGFINDVMASYRSNSGYHSSISKINQTEMLISSLRIVMSKIQLSNKSKNLLNYQLLNLEIKQKKNKQAFLTIIQSKLSVYLKLKVLFNKFL